MHETPGRLFSPSTTIAAALVELGDHLVRRRPAGPCSAASPANCVGALTQECRLTASLRAYVVELARPDRVAEAPAGHRVGLRPAVEQDQPVADRRIGEQADMLLAVIDHVVVDLVRHDRDVRATSPDPATSLSISAFGVTPPVGLAGELMMISRVCRRDQLERLVGREREAVLLADRHRDRRRAGELDHRAIDRKAGVRIHDLGARLAEHQDRHEHRRLAARHDHHFVGRDLRRRSACADRRRPPRAAAGCRSPACSRGGRRGAP